MCNLKCLEFVRDNLLPEEARGKEILESGAQDVNGSARWHFERLGCSRYVGTDIVPGVCVNQICAAEDLVETFGARSFDALVSTEVIEHVKDWRACVSNYKRVLKPGGVLFITTRSEGFPFHEYPIDAWRYSLEDMRAIFADFEILALMDDPSEPGVFIKARRPKKFIEADLTEFALYSITEQRRTRR